MRHTSPAAVERPAGAAAMKVVHVVRSDAFAGVERYISYVAPRLAARGAHVVVVGGEIEAMRRALSPAGVEHVPAATTLEAARALVRCAPVDLVHAHMSAAELAALLARPVTRAPLVATRHFAQRRGRSLAGRAVAFAVSLAVRREIAISQFVADAIERPCTVLVNGVPRRSPARAPRPLVLMAQRLEPEKDVDVGIRAWALSGLADVGWRLLIAGEGSREDELRALARSCGVEASVTFAGRQPSLEPLLDATGIFLATARAEPFGLSVLEAMASAVPVIASASGAHHETVGRCGDAWLFPPGDAHACATRLRTLAADELTRHAYGEALQREQRGRFDIETHVDRLTALYRAVVAALR